MSIKAREVLLIEEFEHYITLGKAMRDECEPDFAFDDKVAYANLFKCINDIERSYVNTWLAWDGDKAIGFGIAYNSAMPFSNETRASLMYWYVMPEYRKTRAAFELLHTFENWASLLGAKRIEVGAAMSGVDKADKLNRMFERRGFNRYGAVYYREPKFT